MKLKVLLGIAALAVCAQTAQASICDVISYSGTATPNGAAVNGNVGPFSWFTAPPLTPCPVGDPVQSGDEPHVQFYSFTGVAGKVVEIKASSSIPSLDLVLSLYSGLISAGTQYAAFNQVGDFDSVIFRGQGDDDPVNPDLRLVLPVSGVYTIALGSISVGSSFCPAGICPPAGAPFSLILQVPEPSTIPLMLVALGGIGWIVRRQRKA